MKFKTALLILLFLFFSNLCFSQIKDKKNAKDIDSIIKYKKMQLTKIEKEKEDLKELKYKLLKIYIALYIKKHYTDNIAEILKNPNYLKILNKEEKFKFIEKALIRKIFAIKKKEESLDIAYKKILKDIKTLKAQKIYVINPLNGRPLKLGKYVFKVKKFTSVKSPITGIVKGITYRFNNISIIIENEKCTASISGLDEIKVNIGDQIKMRKIIGYIKKPKEIFFIVKCKKDSNL